MEIGNLTSKLPYSMRQSLKYLYGRIPHFIRYSRKFWRTYKFLQESQWWPKERLEEYQMQQLEKLLAHSYENVPYYRRVFDERGLKPRNIKSIDDLRKLPYLTKEKVRKNSTDLIAQNYPKSRLSYVTTGGSTGIPLGFYWEKGFTEAKERMFVWRGWRWAGFKPGEKRVILRGNIINRFKDGKRCWWEYNPKDNALILSSYDMTDENLYKYVQKINKFKPVAIQGYPSSLFILANFLKNNKLRIENIRCILTSSETLYPSQRKMIENYLGARIYDHYGNTERNALIMQCEKRNYHIISEYGILELIGKEDYPVSREGEIGEIIATGFNNYAMPFIRYRTGDIATCCNKKCDCGRVYSLLKRIEGRLQEYVVNKDSNLISLGPAIFGIHDVNWTKIKQIQFVQKERGKLIIQIIKDPSCYELEIKEYILNLFRARFGDHFDLEIRFLSHIPRSPSGKYQFLIQKLPIEFRML